MALLMPQLPVTSAAGPSGARPGPARQDRCEPPRGHGSCPAPCPHTGQGQRDGQPLRRGRPGCPAAFRGDSCTPRGMERGLLLCEGTGQGPAGDCGGGGAAAQARASPPEGGDRPPASPPPGGGPAGPPVAQAGGGRPGCRAGRALHRPLSRAVRKNSAAPGGDLAAALTPPGPAPGAGESSARPPPAQPHPLSPLPAAAGQRGTCLPREGRDPPRTGRRCLGSRRTPCPPPGGRPLSCGKLRAVRPPPP